ncbi:MAG: hypothetical protein AAF899_00880 [Pseudomonadota bacterium]
MLAALHGHNPTPFQLVSSYALGAASAALTLVVLGIDGKTALLALLVLDWTAGVVANSAEAVRAWWRRRPHLRVPFIVVHFVELPLVFWLTGGGEVFAILLLVLAAKLSVFMLGAPSPGFHAAQTD